MIPKIIIKIFYISLFFKGGTMMSNNPKISVIVPVYNSEQYLSLCLDSLLNQTYKNIELILIDDGSNDNSYRIMEKYKKSYPKIIKIYKQENKGIGYTRNRGLELVSGSYLTFCDNDDIVEKDYFETFINENDNNYDILVGGYLRKSYQGKILFKRKLKNKELSLYIQQACWGKLYKTDFIRKNKLKFLETKIADEFYFNIIAYNLTDKIKILKETKYHWMYNKKSLSNTCNKKLNYVDELISNLELIDRKLSGMEIRNWEIIKYFYLRTIIYYILFSCKGVSKEKIEKAYDDMFNWLSINEREYHKNKYIGIFKNSGEQLSVKIVISGILLLQRMKLAKFAIYAYSKI